MKPFAASVLFCAGLLAASAQAAEGSVTLNIAGQDGTGAAVGTVRLVDTPYGLALYPSLAGLPPGLHGFHFHENGSCAPARKDGAAVPAGAAGGHFDPQGSKHHGEPWGDGHLGDLPPLFVGADGSANEPVLAPHSAVRAASRAWALARSPFMR